GAVDELVDYDEMTGRQVLAQRAAGRQRQDIADAGTLQGIDVGAVVDRGRRMAMAAAMARHEHHVEAIEHAEQELVGGLAEWRGDAAPLGVLQARNLIDTAAAENSQHRHQLLPVRLGVYHPALTNGRRPWAGSTARSPSSPARPAALAGAPSRCSPARAPRSWRPAGARSWGARSRRRSARTSACSSRPTAPKRPSARRCSR